MIIILNMYFKRIKYIKESLVFILPEKALKGNKLDETQILENNLYEAIESISPDLIKVEYEKGEFIFTIEPFGQLEPKEMLNNAIKEFDYKLDEFSKKLGSSKKKSIKKILTKKK